jgi:hypothetical protein
MTRFKTLLLPVLAALLAGCVLSDDSDADYRMTLSARWILEDSTFIFSVHDEVPQEGMPRGRMSRVRLFAGRVDSARQTYEYAPVFELSGAWSCSDLRIKDSLAVFSYYPYPAEDGADQQGCPSTKHGSRIFAGILGDSLWAPVTPSSDTIGLRALLSEHDLTDRQWMDEGFRWRGNLQTNQDICLENGRCLGSFVESWDAGTE